VRGGKSQRCAFSVRGQFFEFLDDMGILRRMTRSHTHVGEAELVQQLPDIARVIINAEAVLDGFLQVDPPPANDAIDGTIRALLHKRGEFGLLLMRQPGRWSRRPLVHKTIGAGRVEPMHPVA
jgi:hypothetical protein